MASPDLIGRIARLESALAEALADRCLCLHCAQRRQAAERERLMRQHIRLREMPDGERHALLRKLSHVALSRYVEDLPDVVAELLTCDEALRERILAIAPRFRDELELELVEVPRVSALVATKYMWAWDRGGSSATVCALEPRHIAILEEHGCKHLAKRTGHGLRLAALQIDPTPHDGFLDRHELPAQVCDLVIELDAGMRAAIAAGEIARVELSPQECRERLAREWRDVPRENRRALPRKARREAA